MNGPDAWGRVGAGWHTVRMSPASDRPRQPVSAATVRSREDRILLGDGPFAQTTEQIAGFDVIECADLDEAVAIASLHPVAKVGTIEVRPMQQE
jgi:hypothetical protein